VITRLDPPEGKGYLRLLPKEAGVGPDETVPEPTDATLGKVPFPFSPKWQVPAQDVQRVYGGLSTEQIDAARAAGVGAIGDALGLVYRLDNAVNGTSLVLVIEVGTVKLLFAGDAQWGTWEQILGDERSKRILRGTSLFKVGHHGSHNATPKELVQQDYLGTTRAAMVSVDTTKYPGEWQSIPKQSLLEDLRDHGVRVVRSDNPSIDGDDLEIGPGGSWVQVSLDG
jgi:hypothetical protein